MEDHPTPPQSSSNGKFAVLGLLLLVGGGTGIYFLTKAPPPPPTTPPAVVADAGRPPVATPQIGAQIELPPEEPDAGPAVVDAGPQRPRTIIRYVAECNGTLSNPAGVQQTAQSNFGALRACYERELRSNNSLRGPLTAQLKIGTSGRAEEIRVSTPMNSRPLVECVKGVLRRLSYPPARGGCALSEVRFNFSPRD